MALHDPFCDGQPQAGAAGLPVPGQIGAVKPVENVGDAVRGDAQEGIQMTLDFAASIDHTENSVSAVHNDAHSTGMVQTPFHFEHLFTGEIDAEEIHNHNSMAICGDSLKILRQMQSGSVNLIFADAPYNIGKDFGNNQDKWDTTQQYTEWCKIWIDLSTDYAHLVKCFKTVYCEK